MIENKMEDFEGLPKEVQLLRVARDQPHSSDIAVYACTNLLQPNCTTVAVAMAIDCLIDLMNNNCKVYTKHCNAHMLYALRLGGTEWYALLSCAVFNEQ